MNLLLLIAKVKELAVAVAARDWMTVFSVSVELLTILRDVTAARQSGTFAAEADTPELRAAVSDLEAALNSPAPMGVGLLGFNPGTWLALARVVLDLVKSLFGS